MTLSKRLSNTKAGCSISSGSKFMKVLAPGFMASKVSILPDTKRLDANAEVIDPRDLKLKAYARIHEPFDSRNDIVIAFLSAVVAIAENALERFVSLKTCSNSSRYLEYDYPISNAHHFLNAKEPCGIERLRELRDWMFMKLAQERRSDI